MAKQKQDKKAPVNQFMIYDVSIQECQQMHAFEQMDRALALKNAAELFGECFSGRKLNIYRMLKRDGEFEPEVYANDILSVHEGVYLLRINNNKKQKIVEQAKTTTNGIPDYEENTYISNPYCYVVIDNRAEKGICQMAIQKNSAFGEPNNVRKLLMENLNRKFEADGIPLELTISAKMRPSKIWEFCQQRCNEGEDVIQRISFDFPNQKKVASHDRIQKPKGYVKQLAKVMALTNAIKTHISMEYTEADPKAIEKNARDLAEIVRVCKNKSYNLSILFRSYGLYRCDDNVRAMFPMQEKLLNAFRANWEELPFEEKHGLFDWCNYVYKQSKLFDHVEPTPIKRPGKHSK